MSCSSVACYSGAAMRLSFDASYAALDGGGVRACRNELCKELVIRSDNGLGLWPVDVNDYSVTFSFHYSTFDQVTGLELTLTAPSRTDVADGDVYTFEIRDNTGAVVASQQWDATYKRVYPNGEDCDGDYWCRYATLE